MAAFVYIFSDMEMNGPVFYNLAKFSTTPISPFHHVLLAYLFSFHFPVLVPCH